MAVVGFAEEVGEGRRGSKGENGRRTYTRRFKVLTDSAHDGVKTVLSAPLLPQIWNVYQTASETDDGAVVVRHDPAQDPKRRTLWFIDVHYDTQYERKDDDPFADPVELEFDFEPYQEPLAGSPVTSYLGQFADSENGVADPKAKDNITRFGAGITNSAGEPFDPPASRESSRPVVRLTRNEPNFLPNVAAHYVNSVNLSPWSGLEARVAMLKGIKTSFQVRKFNIVGKPDIYYFRTTYHFALKRETWDLSLLNIGTYYLSAAATFTTDGAVSNDVAKLIKRADGRPVKVLLAADGTKLAAGSNPTFRRFRVAPEREFAALNIRLNLNIDELKPKK